MDDAGRRIALVTGAGRGIGRAVAIRLSAQGMAVALTARNREQLAETAQACSGPVLTLPADITSPTAAEELFDAVAGAWGAVEVLVASAGAGHSDRVERTSDQDWARMLELNLSAPFRCIRRAVPSMRAARYGRIVVIASTAAKVGEPYLAAYTASKHGVLGLVRAVAAELAGSGITVNAVCPGYVDTPMTAATVAGIQARTGRAAEEIWQLLANKQPIGRLITAAEVADSVWSCVQGAAITGQGINVDGGAVQS